MHQLTLLSATSELGLDEALTGLRRTELTDGAWVEHCPAFLRGHAALFAHLRVHARWRLESQRMYDKEVTTPRLVASVEEPSPAGGRGLARVHARRGRPVRDGRDLSAHVAARHRQGGERGAAHLDHVPARLAARAC